jgi:hypothetical protein
VKPVQPKPKAARCPAEMALLRRAQGAYCIDRWEASLVRIGSNGAETPHPGNRTIDGIAGQLRAVSVAGRKPQGYISGVQAQRVGSRSGKRLCEVDEWVVACRGSSLSRYPYGEQRQPICAMTGLWCPITIRFDPPRRTPAGTDGKLMAPGFITIRACSSAPRSCLWQSRSVPTTMARTTWQETCTSG